MKCCAAAARSLFADPVRGTDRLRAFAILIVVFGMFYGGVMGTYGGMAGDRFWQVVYSGARSRSCWSSPFCSAFPASLCSTLCSDCATTSPRVVAALLATQAGLTVILASLAPFTAFWYVSGSDYQPAILFNGLMFAVASLSAQWLLRREYRPLIALHPAHRWMLRTWLVIYIFVGIQMGWVLRPFIGNPGAPVQFFREDSWSNAYLAVIEMIGRVMFSR